MGKSDDDKPRRPVTHVLIVTDESGSMVPLADDVRDGFNGFITELRGKEGRFRVTVTVFHEDVRVLCTGAKLREVPQLTEGLYRPHNKLTALLDAIGETITTFEKRVTLGPEDRVMLVVQTDGQENRSRTYTRESIFEMIREREAGGRWSAIFLAAGLDAFKQAGGMGFRDEHTVRVGTTRAATRSTYDGMAAAAAAYAGGDSGAGATRVLAATPGVRDQPE